MNCQNCGSNNSKKFLAPVILGLVIALFYFCDTNVSSGNNLNIEQIEQQKFATSKKQLTTPSEKLYLINEYQAKYFRIIKRNDVLLQISDDYNTERDMNELNELFSEVKAKISNQNYLNKYNKIEERFLDNPGQNTYDMHMFASQHYDAVDGLLNEVYQDVRTKIPQQDFKNLVESEKKWLNNVESYKSVFDSKNFGTIGTTVNLNYEINMKNFRILLLMLYL